MDTVEIIAQIISIFAMTMNILAFQQKSKRGVLVFQLMGTSAFFVSFLMLGALVGAMMNLIAAIRAVVYINADKLKANSVWWMCGFFALYAISYASVFVFFKSEPTPINLIVEFLPVIGMVATTISYRMKDARAIRLLGLVNSPVWLIYNAIAFSVGGMLCDAFSIISIIIGILRLDKKKRSDGYSKDNKG